MASTEEGALVEAARAGDQRAFGQLFDRWFDRVHDLSRRIVHDDGIAGEVAQDAFLKAWTKLDSLDDPDAFGGWLLRIARNGSLNRLAKERRAVTMDDEAMSAVRDADAADHDPLQDMDQAARISLVWDAAAALGPRDASVLDLHLRHGLSPAELAEELGVTPNNAHQVLFTMRKRLGNAVRALVLWRAGHPTCPDLRQGLSAAGLTSFAAPMVKAIDRHVDGCAACSVDRTERVSPLALFAAAPIAIAPVLLKAQAASALAGAGIPMAGSAAATGAAGAAGSGAAGSGPAGSGPGGSAPAGSGSGVEAGSGEPGPDRASEADDWRPEDPGPTSGSADTGPPTGSDAAFVLAPPAPDGEASRRRSRRRLLAAAAVVLVVLSLVGGAVAWGGVDGERQVASTDTLPAGAGTSTSDTPAPGGATTAPVGSPTSGLPAGDPAPGTDPRGTAPATAPPTTVAPPVVDRFEAMPTDVPCSAGDGDYAWTVAWDTTGADTAVLGPSGTPGQPVGPDGTTTFCAPSGTTFTLDATGPGGTTSATAGGGTVPTTTTTTAPTTTSTQPPIIG